MRPARDQKGNFVGKDAVSPKYGTPKCEFIAELLYVDELGYDLTWVGAHPKLGEKIAEEFIKKNLLLLPEVKSYKREVANPGGSDMRADFVIKHVDDSLKPRVLEVKTVVDTDYSKFIDMPNNNKVLYTSDKVPYQRAAIFPWGQSSRQKGQDEKRLFWRVLSNLFGN